MRFTYYLGVGCAALCCGATVRWLTHDNTPQAPTDTIVPGLLASR